MVYKEKESYEKSLYKDILFDFTYLERAEEFEDEIQSNVNLIELDESFRETYQDIIERFYLVFNSIYMYYLELLQFIENVNTGFFIQHTLETIVTNVEGKQLMAEAMNLFGVQLLLLDRLIPYYSRERLLISYYRYKGQLSIENINEIFRMCRRTGYISNKPLPERYPVEYFKKFPLSQTFVHTVIN
jgi:WASH complex subunit strumpellin